MLDVDFIRQNIEQVKKGIAAKGFDASLIDRVVRLDDHYKTLLGEVEQLRSRRNKFAKEKDIEKGKLVKSQLQKKEPELKQAEKEFGELLYQIPNLPAEDVPRGESEKDNMVVKTWGQPTKFSFTPKDHLALGERLDIIDVQRAAKISGSRFGYLKGSAVGLEFALVRWALDTLVGEGFVPIVPPVLIKEEAMRGMGYMEAGGVEDMYRLRSDGLVLVGTSEQSIGPMHMGETLNRLPRRYVGFSSCFRREAGSYGKDTRGILRVHQFDKVEMISLTLPEESDHEHEYFLSLEEKFFQALEIPYQIVISCTGDLGFPVARKYDIEAWLPSENRYREVTSTSTTTDFQARRLNIRYRQGSTTSFVHILNGTAFAIGRTILSILENYQQKDGSIQIPKVLRKYTSFSEIKPQNL